MAGALKNYCDALEIDQAIARQYPNDAGWQGMLSGGYERVGDVQSAQGEINAALSSYQKALEIAEKLAARTPANPQWQTGLAISLAKLASVLERQGPAERQQAAANFERALSILRPLAIADRLTAEQKRLLEWAEARLSALRAQHM